MEIEIHFGVSGPGVDPGGGGAEQGSKRFNLLRGLGSSSTPNMIGHSSLLLPQASMRIASISWWSI
jgi:hypothetical protein